uniref:Hcy-binding domain-containing protein n=1 Tax=Parascaris univalens TaxID=6257 RepID=A0A915C6N9_PARUN
MKGLSVVETSCSASANGISKMVEHKPRIVLSRVLDSVCDPGGNDPPPWTNELHGLSQALFSKTPRMRIFWWFIILICIICGTTTTVLVILEYIHGPTATSTTIRLTESLELPAITVCPKIADAFDLSPLFSDMRTSIPEITDEQRFDLLRFWIGGTGFENMKTLQTFNESYLSKLDEFYKKWSKGYTYEQFFNTVHNKYGYSCRDLFYKCELGGQTCDCCSKIFQKRVVMRRGICYETRRGVNQTKADDIGRLVVLMKALVSVTSYQYGYVQPQMIVYVTDNYDHVVDFPRFYLYQNQWNRMRFTARFIELLQHPDICTEKIVGKDAACFIRRWLLSNVVYPYNCTFPYLNITIPQKVQACSPFTIASNYYNAIQLGWFNDVVNEVCTPGCKRWDYTISLQQSETLQPFKDYAFNLEASYNELQYEYIKEVYTTSVPGFMSQIGGQFGFFLGLSILTFIQITLYILHYCAIRILRAINYCMRWIANIAECQRRKTSLFLFK